MYPVSIGISLVSWALRVLKIISKTLSLVGFSALLFKYLSLSLTEWAEAAGGGPTPVGGGMANSKKTNKYQKEKVENSEI